MNVYRVVTNPFPGLSALAELVDPAHPEDLEELIALRNETDEVVRAAATSALSTVLAADRYVGTHAAIVMAPFLWLSASRFSPGSFGALYMAASLETAVRESAFHAAEIASASIASPPARLPRVAVTLTLEVADHVDIRRPAPVDPRVYNPVDYSVSQQFGARSRAMGHDGIRYSSVRDIRGECFATFRPVAVRSVDDRATNLDLIWDGERVHSYEIVESFAL